MDFLINGGADVAASWFVREDVNGRITNAVCRSEIPNGFGWRAATQEDSIFVIKRKCNIDIIERPKVISGLQKYLDKGYHIAVNQGLAVDYASQKSIKCMVYSALSATIILDLSNNTNPLIPDLVCNERQLKYNNSCVVPNGVITQDDGREVCQYKVECGKYCENAEGFVYVAKTHKILVQNNELCYTQDTQEGVDGCKALCNEFGKLRKLTNAEKKYMDEQMTIENQETEKNYKNSFLPSGKGNNNKACGKRGR